MSKLVVPRKAVYRLSLYHRSLQRLKANRVATVSSEALAKAAGVKPTQLRKDLTYFGQFGTRGLGYNVEALSAKVTEVLGHARLQPVILVGVGHLGSALLRYSGFAKEGFEITAAFDLEPRNPFPDMKLDCLGMDALKDYVQANRIRMAILAVPASAAQDVANQLVDAGIQGMLNFSPVLLELPEGVMVNNVDLAIELEYLSYFVR